MSPTAMYAVDLAAIAILVFGLFLPRHRRPELVVAFLTVNIGVLAVTAALSSSTVGVGLGLGLFGILSIIRLRSEELAQSEIAYYFASLTLGLLAGLGQTDNWISVGLMAAVLAAVAIGDSFLAGRRTASLQLLLDRAITDHAALMAHLEGLLGTTVTSAHVIRTDLVNDTTLVNVRHQVRTTTRSATPTGIPQQELIR